MNELEPVMDRRWRGPGKNWHKRYKRARKIVKKAKILVHNWLEGKEIELDSTYLALILEKSKDRIL